MQLHFFSSFFFCQGNLQGIQQHQQAGKSKARAQRGCILGEHQQEATRSGRQDE